MGRDTVGSVIQHVVIRLVYCRNACPTTGRLLVNPWDVLASRQCFVKAPYNADAISSQTHLCPDAAASGLI